MTILKTFSCFFLFSSIVIATNANASRRDKKEEPPKIYQDRAKALLDSIANSEFLSDSDPLTKDEKKDFKEVLRKRDEFSYSKSDSLSITNHLLPVSLRTSGIHKVKLGHTFTTTLVFTDAAGNPWSADTLTDVSDTDVVSVVKKAPHILTVRPLKRAGQTNLPIKLMGHQRPIMFLFNISEDEVYFNVDVQIDSLGDHVNSQQITAVNQYSRGVKVSPKLSVEPAKEQMLQLLTPDGYQDKRLFDEFREPVDPRDFVAWTKNGRLYILTPHDSYTPDPIDITSASDGMHQLFEFAEVPVISVRKGSKIILLYIE
jgi:hypothetical protein